MRPLGHVGRNVVIGDVEDVIHQIIGFVVVLRVVLQC